MAFVLPTWVPDQQLNIWHGATWTDYLAGLGTTVIPQFLSSVLEPDSQPGDFNLAFGRRAILAEAAGFAPEPLLFGQLLLGIENDVRAFQGVSGIPDLVEVVLESGMLFVVLDVQELGGGFANAHWLCLVQALGPSSQLYIPILGQTYSYAGWPEPYPTY
jgi:hypothetical protein